MKKTIAWLLTAVMITATACGSAGNSTTGSSPEAAATAASVQGQTQSEEQTQTETGSQNDGTAVTGEEPVADPASQTRDSIPYWNEDSAVAESIISYVREITDESSENFVPAEDRIVVFDFDGTLYGELYPTYFDTCLMMHRALHDDTYEAPAQIREYAAALEDAFTHNQPEPDSKLSAAQSSAEMFKGLTYEQYCEYIRNYMAEPAYGFHGMTYAEGFYKPMTALVEYLADNDFTVFISSGSERTIVRELIKGKLDQWIPSYRVIGSTFSFNATNQGDMDGRKYTYAADDEVLLEGNLLVKNQKANKVFSIINEIGKTPVLVFGNSSGDLAMGQYVINNGGKGYMLLCDDTERDYGKLDVAASFAAECEKIGLETVSMKNDFATIYGDQVKKAETQSKPVEEISAEETSPAEASTADAPAEETPAEETPAEEEQELQPAA